MKDKIFSFVLAKLIDLLLGSMTEEQVKREMDRLIDRLEELIIESENTIDDNLLDLLKFVRDAFNVPDYPDN